MEDECSYMSKLTVPIEDALPMPNIKLANPAVVLSNVTVSIRRCNALSCPIPSVEQVAALESMSNPLNSVSSY